MLYKNAKHLNSQLHQIVGACVLDACDIWLGLLANPLLEPHMTAILKVLRSEPHHRPGSSRLPANESCHLMESYAKVWHKC